jgi:hypothetical protein
VSDEKVITSKSGKKYRAYHQDLLDKMPPDIVQELAQRRLEEINTFKQEEEKAK